MKKIGRICFCNLWVLLSLVFLGTVHAQTTLTLSQAIVNGLGNKKNILAGKLDVTISNLQTKALYRKYYPRLSAEYQYLYNPILQTSILPIGIFNPSYPVDATKSVQFGTKWTQTAGLTATLPLFDLSIQKQINEAKLQERIAALSQQQSEYDLAYTIAQAYIEVYLEEAKNVSLIADTTRTYISHTLLKNKFDEKRLLKSDLNKAKVNHNKTIQLLADGVSQLVQDKVYLLFLMGTTDINKWDFAIDTTFTTKFTFENLDTSVDVGQFSDLQQIALQRNLTDLQAKSESSKHLPIVGFKGYLGANQFANTFDPVAKNSWYGLSYVGLNIKVPILFGESPHNKKQQLKMQ